jgi:NADPH:quinone reductase-like Zn-dependent oxidoreductase
MRAAIIDAFDRSPRYSEFKDPVAAEGEVIINVAAAGLHPIVRALANGTHYGSTSALPFVPGVDGVGNSIMAHAYSSEFRGVPMAVSRTRL